MQKYENSLNNVRHYSENLGYTTKKVHIYLEDRINMDLTNRYILWITSFKTNLQFKVGLNHCFQLFGGKIGNTSLFNQREYFFILSNNILTFFTVNRC